MALDLIDASDESGCYLGSCRLASGHFYKLQPHVFVKSCHNSVHPLRNLKAHALTLWECGVLLVFRGCSQLHEVEYDESFCHIGKVCR